MFVHIGHETVVIDSEIIGIFDMDNTTVMKSSVDFLNKAEKKGMVRNVAPYELPKSYVVCKEPNGVIIYISPISVGTILKRINLELK